MAEDSRPATKQDLNELRQEMHELSGRLVEQLRDMQTEVLRAFHDWAQPVEIKLVPSRPSTNAGACSKNA